MRYKYKTEPYMHQRDVLNTSWNKDDWALFLDMGTGKSKIIIDNAAMLYDIGKINGLVIVAPKGVYLNWIEEEIPRHLPERIPHKMAAYVSGAKSQVKLRRLKRLFESGDELHILVINVEALATKAGYAVVERFLGNHESMFVIDESTTIKNPKANRTVAALRLSNHAVYRRIASGAPITQSPMDLYAQCAFLDPELLGFASYYAFRNRYAIMKDMYVGPRSFKSVIGFKNLDELSKKLEGFSSRVLKGQCLDLPPKIYQVRKVPLTDEQDFHYHNLLKYATSKIEEEQVSVTIILTLLQKLHQVCCGFIKMDTGVEKRLDERREHELIQILDETSGKAIIWCYYQYNIRSVTGRLKRVFGVNSTASYFGETDSNTRPEIVKEFQDPDSELRFLVGQPATGGRGLTLTAAKTVIYFSNSYNLEHRIQSEDRAHRIGQEDKVTYIDLIAPGTIDERIVEALKKKQNIADLVVDGGWRRLTEPEVM